jgi:hypothetical protein
MATKAKFKPPVMTRRAGFKNTDHSAASGWHDNVVSAVKAGTPAELKRHPIAYHGNPPHVQDDLSAPIEARPSAIPAEPQDVPGADDQTRKVDPTPYPTTHGHKSPNKSGTVPAKCGGK